MRAGSKESTRDRTKKKRAIAKSRKSRETAGSKLCCKEGWELSRLERDAGCGSRSVTRTEKMGSFGIVTANESVSEANPCSIFENGYPVGFREGYGT